ncbi:hypothetical protein E2C01_075020 [Portunus trituberculatus]|uniref:Uncharacterized protein n=1 Tax=Portunus trituberculatus TaxID=210409 RepID=A0A5B7I7D7_PORTR|nr:hypothetical protein [Portunus trituberculatus]
MKNLIVRNFMRRGRNKPRIIQGRVISRKVQL